MTTTEGSLFTRLMYCTTSLTNDLLISSFSLRAKKCSSTVKPSTAAAVNLWYRATSGGQSNTQLQDSTHSAADTYSSVMFLSLDLASLIFSCRFLSIFFLRSFFSLWRATQGEWRSKKQKQTKVLLVSVWGRWHAGCTWRQSYFSQMSRSFLNWALWHSSAIVVSFSTSCMETEEERVIFP